MGYVRRLETAGKVKISEKLKEEIETVYLYGIVQKINQHRIPSSMKINSSGKQSDLVQFLKAQGKFTFPFRCTLFLHIFDI